MRFVEWFRCDIAPSFRRLRVLSHSMSSRLFGDHVLRWCEQVSLSIAAVFQGSLSGLSGLLCGSGVHREASPPDSCVVIEVSLGFSGLFISTTSRIPRVQCDPSFQPFHRASAARLVSREISVRAWFPARLMSVHPASIKRWLACPY